MVSSILLRGYRLSVYNRIAAIVLREKGVAYEREEVDPFAPNLPVDFRQRHPFGRVPVLSHDGFDIYETTAIARYVDAIFDGPSLVPTEPKALARMAQVVSIVDSYAYRAMVRQVFAHRVFRPLEGERADEGEIAAGLEASHTVLGALDRIAAEGRVLEGEHVTLADCHLAPMLAYFVQAPEGAEALSLHAALTDWWEAISDRPSVRATDPQLPDGRPWSNRNSTGLLFRIPQSDPL